MPCSVEMPHIISNNQASSTQENTARSSSDRRTLLLVPVNPEPVVVEVTLPQLYKAAIFASFLCYRCVVTLRDLASLAETSHCVDPRANSCVKGDDIPGLVRWLARWRRCALWE